MKALAMLGALAIAGAGVVGMGSTVATSHAVEVRPISSPAQPQQAPAPVEKQVIRETRQTRLVRYSRGIPASIKNRGPGERAHRRWRKTRAAGLAA